MKIQILGSGCAKCRTLTAVAEQAANDLGLEYEVEKITDVDALRGFRRDVHAGTRGGWRGEGQRQGAVARRSEEAAELTMIG